MTIIILHNYKYSIQLFLTSHNFQMYVRSAVKKITSGSSSVLSSSEYPSSLSDMIYSGSKMTRDLNDVFTQNAKMANSHGRLKYSM